MGEENKVSSRWQMGRRGHIIVIKKTKQTKTRIKCYKAKAITRQRGEMKMEIWVNYLVMENQKLISYNSSRFVVHHFRTCHLRVHPSICLSKHQVFGKKINKMSTEMFFVHDWFISF